MCVFIRRNFSREFHVKDFLLSHFSVRQWEIDISINLCQLTSGSNSFRRFTKAKKIFIPTWIIMKSAKREWWRRSIVSSCLERAKKGKAWKWFSSSSSWKLNCWAKRVKQIFEILYHLPMIVTLTRVLIDLLSSVLGEPGDDQPFVANHEKVNTNLYLYSVSTQWFLFGFIFRIISHWCRVNWNFSA